MTVNAPPITVEQYEGFEGFPGLRDELINGEIVLSPQPKPLHQQVSDNVAILLNRSIGAEFVAKQNSNIKFREANSMPAPGVFVVLRAEWRKACEADQYLETAPLLVVEVISPANRKLRVSQKVDLYLSYGVPAVWVVYPMLRLVRIYRVDGYHEFVESDVIALSSPFAGEIKIRDIFSID